MIAKRGPLYWGDNGKHEFWEDEDRVFLILRVHGETSWSAHRQHGFLFFCGSEKEAATRLNLVLSDAKKWIKTGDQFVLESQADKSEA